MHWVFYTLASLCLSVGGVSLWNSFVSYGPDAIAYRALALLGLSSGVVFLSIAAVVGALHRIADKLDDLVVQAPSSEAPRADV